MRMKLSLDRFDKNWKHLEHQEQWSRSFTLGFIELLYTATGRVVATTPFNTTDIDRVTRSIDSEAAESATTGMRGMHFGLRVSSTPGITPLSAHAGALNAVNMPPTDRAYFSGADIGIQVGLDNTAVTPTDRRLVKRISHGRRTPDAGDVTFESYTVLDDTDRTMNGAAVWTAQEFIPRVSHQIYSVDLKIWKTGNPGDLTVSIKGEDTPSGSRLPTSSLCPDLAVGTILQAAIPAASPGALTNCAFGTPVTIYAGHRYAIVARALGSSGGNSVQWRYDNLLATYERAWNPFWPSAFSRRMLSADSGATWALTDGSALLFQENGRSLGELEIGGCELSNLVFADPNGSFDIKRFFTNHCGSALAIAEVGINAIGQRSGVASALCPFVFLIARDYQDGAVWVAPIVVANTEILLVTYTPSITV